MFFMVCSVSLLVLMTESWTGWREQEFYGPDGVCGGGGSA